ncbi:MAG: NADH-quinone oxidoreductase subunit A [Rickettsiales bacterium]|nr:NADH-quinone oxidoreductase subunit A [Rickettsiales bacterium]|tara:strand:- start:3307 stop:3660 length:354 start_codon:yes stop_codon:yes gene_type:complete
MADNYLSILIFFFVAGGLATVIIVASVLLAKRNPSADKGAPYECGFEPLSAKAGKFDVRFYLIALLFIIFDLEIAFLFPWAVSLKTLGWPGFLSMMIFLTVLTVGFIYEWKKGALDW